MSKIFLLVNNSEHEANSIHAAMMEDRLLVNEDKKQIYGTQATSDSSTNGKAYISGL